MQTILYWLPRNSWCILWCFRSQFISAGRDPQNLIWSDQIWKTQPLPSTTNLNSLSFQNPQNSLNISSGHDAIHTFNSLQRPFSPISCLGVYFVRWWLSYPFRAGVKVPIWRCIWTKRHRVVQSITKLNNKI